MRVIKLITQVILALAFQVAAVSVFAQNTTVSVCVKNLLSSNIVLCTGKNCGGVCSKQCVGFGEVTLAQTVPLNALLSVCFANSQCEVAMLGKNFNAPVKGQSQQYLAQDPSGDITVTSTTDRCP